MITCISVLEHIEDSDRAVRNMFSLLNDGGHLLLTCPYSEDDYVANVYTLPGSSYGQNAPYITQSYSRRELTRWVEENGASIVEQEFWQFWQGKHWTVGDQIIPPERVESTAKHQLSCIHLQKST